jgi:hypothetical protein
VTFQKLHLNKKLIFFIVTAVLQSFISRARTMEHLEEFSKIQKFAEAKAEDKSLMTKHREIRKKV